MPNISLTGRVCVCVALLAFFASYFQQYPQRLVMLENTIPVVGKALSNFHGFIMDLNRKLSVTPPNTNNNNESGVRGEMIFSDEELSRFNGEKGSPGIYLAILGQVFDVTKGSKHYGPGGGYHAFAGRDASRAFVTGDFSDSGVTNDVKGLSPEDIKSIQDWLLFYHKEYTYKGKVSGQYYTSTGEQTDYHKEIQSLIQQANDDSAAKNADFMKYPPCNVEWTPETGSKVWCSNRSGGIERDWSGVPRKYYKPGSDSYRCACIELTHEVKQSAHKQRQGNIEAYIGCPPDSDSCYVSDEK